MSVANDTVIAETRAWVERVVIGLNLCPFAKAPQAKGRVRYVVSEATDTEALRRDLLDELRVLSEAPAEQVETTLLIAPQVLQDFDDYNTFLAEADGAVAELRLRGVIQVASFHPQYRFAGSAPDDLGNATNRSPFATLHLIREASIERAVAAFPDAAAIFEANIATMRGLGSAGWAALQRQCRADAAAATAAVAIGIAVALLAAGCASPGKPVVQTVQIETPGCSPVACELSNDQGRWTVPSTPGAVAVSTSRTPLTVSCRAEGGARGSRDTSSSVAAASGAGAVAGGVVGGVAVGAALGATALAFIPPLGLIAVLSGAAVGAAGGQAVESHEQAIRYPPLISVPMDCTPAPAPRLGLGIRGLPAAP